MKKLGFLTMVLVIVLVGCSESAGDKLVGEWVTNDDCDTKLGEGITFMENGEVTVNDGDVYKEWELNKENTILTLSNSQYGSREYDFKQIEEDVISIIEDDVKWQETCELTKTE